MKERGLQLALLGSALALAFLSAQEWAHYIGNGITYGNIFGLPGRERDLAAFRSRATTALEIAIASEALAVGVVSWVFTSNKSVGTRLYIPFALAAGVSGFTFALVRPG